MPSPRIAYVCLNLVSLAGLDSAFRAQGRASQRPGGPRVDMYVLGDREGTEDGVRFVRLRVPKNARLARWQRRLFKYALVSQADAFREYDVVVMRYVPAIDLAPLVLVRRSRARIATVHHAKEEIELRTVGHPVAARGRALLERVQSPRLLERVHGIVGVTDEIRDYELAKLKAPKPATTVSNGVDVERVAATAFVPLGDRLVLAFIASAQAPWHGVDRLIRGLEAYRGKLPVLVHLIGGGIEDAPSSIDDRVAIRNHGVLRGPALDDILRTCTMGISTLAMFRTGLRQAAVLKTREYMARGLPFVYGYEEMDVPSDAPYALRVPADESPLDVEQLIAFAASASRRPDLSREMRAFAARELDWEKKLHKLAAFARTLA